jgi:hypothetical protein
MGESRVSKDFDQLVSYVEENLEDFFLKGSLNDLKDLLNKVFGGPHPLDLETQREFFLLSMKCYPLFVYALDRDLNSIPELLRYCLLSKSLYSQGSVETPNGISAAVDELLEEVEDEWYENDAIGHRVYNLREMVLRNPSLDLAILTDEFYSSGDGGSIGAILSSPNCPREFLVEIINSDHIVFEVFENAELISEAKEILANRQ